MKVYVIKRNNATYYKRYFDNYVQFEDEIAFAEIYIKKNSAEDTMDFIIRNKYKFNILPEELSVVEISLMNETDLSDHDKQVRKEVCKEIWQEFEQRLMNKKEDMSVMKVANMINSVLDQLQGERV